MVTTYIADYLERGVAAARPATPLVGTALAFYDATDTGALSYWNGSAWVALNNVSLSAQNRWTAGQCAVPVQLTDGATINTNLALGNNFFLTISGNRTLANPTGILAGQAGQIAITQGVSGSHTLAYGSFWKFPGGVAPPLSTAAGAIDIISYYAIDATHIATVTSLNFS